MCLGTEHVVYAVFAQSYKYQLSFLTEVAALECTMSQISSCDRFQDCNGREC